MGGEVVQIDDGVSEWEDGLPSADEIPLLSQCLIPPQLAVAFKISPETPRTLIDVNRASEYTMSSLRSSPNFKTLDGIAEDQAMVEPDNGGSDSKRRIRAEDDSGVENSMDDQSKSSKKRARLVWTPQLHKRFVEVVAHLELKNAVPKTIMSLMNVEGLTRENVASHLQKYRLYVKRMQGLSNEGPSPSDHLFASTPLPRHTFHESAVSSGGGNRSDNHTNNVGGSRNGSHASVQIPMIPYPPPPQIMPMPVMGMAAGSANSSGGYNGYEAMNGHHHYHHHHHHYQQQYNNAIHQQQRDWSGNKFTSTYSHGVTHNNK